MHRYGEDTQLLVLAEECNELARAIVRHMQNRSYDKRDLTLSAIKEEMADVENLLDQFREGAGWGMMLTIIKLTKLARLYNRLKGLEP
jgi:vacuolar-type H+-ATPase subunit I/STV1